MKAPVFASFLATALGAGAAFAGNLFIDNFDNQKPRVGLPNGYTAFGTYKEIGVTAAEGSAASKPNGAYITLDLGSSDWGAGIAHYYGRALDLRDAILAVQIKSSVDMSKLQGAVAFRISDLDGTVVRTHHVDLHSTGTEFVTFFQLAKKLDFEDEPGRVPGIDLENITSIGLIFYARGDCSETVTFHFDDLRIQD
jgi:hypothetical protein